MKHFAHIDSYPDNAGIDIGKEMASLMAMGGEFNETNNVSQT